MFSSFQGQHLFILGGLYVKNSNWLSNRRTNHHQSPNFLEIFIQVFATVVVILVDGKERNPAVTSRGEGSWNPITVSSRLEFPTIPGWVFSPNSGVWIDGFFPQVGRFAVSVSWRKLCTGLGGVMVLAGFGRVDMVDVSLSERWFWRVFICFLVDTYQILPGN